MIILWVLWVHLTLSNEVREIEKFGLLTVTHARNGDNGLFMMYLERYAEMECPEVMEINVVWNNEASPQQMGVYERVKNWKRPVYFYHTSSNSMNYRYKLHPEASATVYFSVDDDIIISCSEMVEGFNKWKQHAIGEIAPLIGYGPRSYDFNNYYAQFTYQYGQGPQYQSYALLLMGMAWVPRHYLLLYYLDTWEVTSIRKLVRERNNCDDIAMNFIVNHFYPEFENILLPTPNSMDTHPQQGQSNTHSHIPYRNECLNEFTRVLGYNPIRFALKNITMYSPLVSNPQLQFLTTIKMLKLQQLIIKNTLPDENQGLVGVAPPSYLYQTKQQIQRQHYQALFWVAVRGVLYMLIVVGILCWGKYKT